MRQISFICRYIRSEASRVIVVVVVFFCNLESPTPTTMRNGVYAEYSRTIFVAVDCLDRSVQFRIECNQAIQNWSAVL